MTGLRRIVPPLIVLMLGALFVWQAIVAKGNASKLETEQTAKEPWAATTIQQSHTRIALPAIQDYQDRLERLIDNPLFFEARNTPQQPDDLNNQVEETASEQPAPKIENTPEPPAIAFRGYMRNGSQLHVLLLLQNSLEEIWVAVGDSVLEWNVAFVSESMVRLERGEFEHVVEKSQ